MSRKGLVIEDVFGVGSDPYANFEWEKRTVESKDGDKVIFKQEVEAPKHWSMNAVETAATKYFRGNLGTPGREYSVKQVFNRVADEIVKHGVAKGVFDKASGKVFGNQIKYLLVLQAFSFNSPVYFNVGAEPNPQSAACFTLPVNDSLESIVEAQKMLVWIFSRGSGGGYNLSTLREMGAPLSKGGFASGPLSFLRGFDSWGGIIHSGGVQRRAAMLGRLDCWHPDIMEFITAKVKEEHKARALVKKGYSVAEAYATISLQNVNLSVGLTDAFMRAAIENKDWALKSVLTGKPVKTEKAEKILNAIAENAHFCGDPGVQFDDTINRWNPLIKMARILGTNPCLTGDTKVYVKEGNSISLKRIDSIEEGDAKVMTYDFEKRTVTASRATFLGKTRQNTKVVKLKTAKGEIRLTPDHEVMTNRGWIRASDIQKGDKVYRLKNQQEKA